MKSRSLSNGRRTLQDPRALIVHLFEQVQSRPEHPAVREAGEAWTYRQLWQRAEAIAAGMHARGVGPGQRIATILPRGFDTIATFVAALRLGAAYVPIELEDPQARRQQICELADVQLVVGAPSDAVGEHPILTVSALASTETGPLPPIEHVSPDAIAYVMFTSGSTGEPKGVAVSQRAVAVYAADTSHCRIEPRDCVLHNALLSFDASTAEIWGALRAGAQLVIQPIARPTLDDIQRTLRAGEVSVAMIPAGLFHALVDAGADTLETLRWIVVGGDVLSGKHVHRLLERASCPIVTNGYGPTEACVLSVCAVFSSVQDLPVSGRMPIGTPMDNTSAYVLDAALEPVDVGQTGELWLGGSSLADGYLDPQMTQRRFVLDPFSEGDRMYKTGDIASMDGHGVLWFHGRADRMVKIHGVRAELGELEAVLRRAEHVDDCAVVKSPSGGLVAHVVAPDRFNETEIRAYAASQLIDVLVPERFVEHDALPLAKTGKVDLAALAAFRHGEGGQSQLSALERSVARLWLDALPVDTVRQDDSFFELGGNSLMAARLVQQLSARFEVQLSVGSIYRWPTLALLSKELSRLGASADGLADQQA